MAATCSRVIPSTPPTPSATRSLPITRSTSNRSTPRRTVLVLDAEIIELLDPSVGLLHRGTDKLIVYKSYLRALPYFLRLDYGALLGMDHSYVLAIEKLLDLEVPAHAQYLRSVFAELT